MTQWIANVRAFFRENPAMGFVAIAGVLAAILVAWFAFGGFSIEIGRFFASDERQRSAETDGGTPNVGGGGSSTQTDTTVTAQTTTDTTTQTETTTADTSADSTGQSAQSAAGATQTVALATTGTTTTVAAAITTTTTTSDPNDPGAGVLKAQCTGGNTPRFTVRWSKSPPFGSSGPYNQGNPPVLNRSINSSPLQTNPPAADKGTYWEWTDSTVPSDGIVSYTGKYSASVGTNTVTLSAGPTDCGAVAQISAASESASANTSESDGSSAVACAPVRQTVRVDRVASLDASGGNSVYSWTVQGGSIEEGGNDYIGVRYRTTGRKTLRVNSGGESATCTVDVVSETAAQTQTPVPASAVAGAGSTAAAAPATGLMVGKWASNASVRDPMDRPSVIVYPGQTLTFKIRVTNMTGATVSGLRVSDTVPAGMSYLGVSTFVDAKPALSDAVITTMGIPLSQLLPTQTVVIQWSAIANKTTSIPSGPNLLTPDATVRATGLSDVSAEMSVTLYGSGGRSGLGIEVGAIPTGPGSAAFLALLAAAALTLLYSGYTRSAYFRRREIDVITRDKDTLDFRSQERVDM